MKMAQFNDLMTEMGLRYSIMVLFDLGTAVVFGKRVKYWQGQLNQLQAKLESDRADDYASVKARYEKNLADSTLKFETAQHNALASGMFEKDNGLIFEPMIDEYKLSDLNTINNAIRPWISILKKYDIDLKTY